LCGLILNTAERWATATEAERDPALGGNAANFARLVHRASDEDRVSLCWVVEIILKAAVLLAP
jgi:hypothetical protein